MIWLLDPLHDSRAHVLRTSLSHRIVHGQDPRVSEAEHIRLQELVPYDQQFCSVCKGCMMIEDGGHTDYVLCLQVLMWQCFQCDDRFDWQAGS